MNKKKFEEQKKKYCASVGIPYHPSNWNMLEKDEEPCFVCYGTGLQGERSSCQICDGSGTEKDEG